MSEPANGISVVIPVLDDLEGIREVLEALTVQTRLPDECVVVDGGSRDGTAELLASWPGPFPLRVITQSERNIAASRNRGVAAASAHWIACTDAGCRPDPGWLEAIDAARAEADFVAGVVEIDARNDFERVLALTHYPARDELVDPRPWIRVSHRLFGRGYVAERSGGGNMAFSKAVWRAAGGFPEEVYAGEDRALTGAAVRGGFRVTRSAAAVVRWRPPGTWMGNARMFFTYSRGDIRLPGRKRHVVRLLAWLIGAYGFTHGRRSRLAVMTGGLCYIALPLHRASRARLRAGLWWRIPLVVALKDLAQIVGSATGLIDMARGLPQPPPPRRRTPGR
jgi:glycosyltransferase involved in cell wall biosynthesis